MYGGITYSPPEGPVDLSRVPNGTLGEDRMCLTLFQFILLKSQSPNSHLPMLVTALGEKYARVIGHQLGILHPGLNDSAFIEIHDQQSRGEMIETCMSEILAMLLNKVQEKIV